MNRASSRGGARALKLSVGLAAALAGAFLLVVFAPSFMVRRGHPAPSPRGVGAQLPAPLPPGAALRPSAAFTPGPPLPAGTPPPTPPAAPSGAGPASGVSASPGPLPPGSQREVATLSPPTDREAGAALIQRLQMLVEQAPPDSEEAMDRQRRLGDAYAQLAERLLERVAFQRYLGMVERRLGKAEAARQAMAKATTRFHQEHDYLDALGYCDLVISRYPGSDQEWEARFMVGDYYRRTKDPMVAVEQFRLLVNEAPTSPWARRARRELPSLLFNLGYQDEAIAALRQLVADAGTPDDAANARLSLAMTYYAQGPKSFAVAQKELRSLISLFPNHSCAKSAAGMLKKIDEEMAGGALDRVLP